MRWVLEACLAFSFWIFVELLRAGLGDTSALSTVGGIKDSHPGSMALFPPSPPNFNVGRQGPPSTKKNGSETFNIEIRGGGENKGLPPHMGIFYYIYRLYLSIFIRTRLPE